MKKLLFIIAMTIATTAHASTAPVLECSGSNVDYEFAKNILVTGTVKNTGKLPV